MAQSPPILIWSPEGGTPAGETPIPRPPITNSELTQLVLGQSYVDVTFDTEQTDNTWIFVECSVVNTTDSDPLNIWPGIITVKTSTGFRVYLNGLPDSNNYFLNWAISGVNIPPPEPFPATTYSLSGPATGGLHIDSTEFTVRLPVGGTVATPVTVTPSAVSGTFTPATVTLTTGSPSATFTYNPASYGEKTISTTNDSGLTDPGSLSFTCVATGYTFIGPSSGGTGVASTNFTVELPTSGVVIGTVTVTPSSGGGGGTFTPTSVGLTTAAPSATFTYTPASTGTKTISVTNNGSLTNPTDISYVVSAPFVPTDIAGLKVWLKADSLGLTDGAAVSAWTDQSGSGNDFTGDAIHQIYKTGIVNGKPVVRFLAGGTGLLRNAAIANSQFTIFVVAAVSTIGSQGVFYASGQIGASSFYFLNNSGALYQGFFTSPGSPVTATEAAGLAVGVWNVLMTDWNGTNIHLWRNGTLKDTTGATTRGNTGNANSVGVAWTESFGTYEGDIAEVLVYDTALSSTDRDNVTGYLQAKYAL